MWDCIDHFITRLIRYPASSSSTFFKAQPCVIDARQTFSLEVTVSTRTTTSPLFIFFISFRVIKKQVVGMRTLLVDDRAHFSPNISGNLSLIVKPTNRQTKRPVMTAGTPYGPTPSGELAKLKLCAIPAPTIMPITKTAASPSPSPARKSCRPGHVIPALLPAPAAYQTYDSNKGRLIYSSIGDLSNLPNKRRKQS